MWGSASNVGVNVSQTKEREDRGIGAWSKGSRGPEGEDWAGAGRDCGLEGMGWGVRASGPNADKGGSARPGLEDGGSRQPMKDKEAQPTVQQHTTERDNGLKCLGPLLGFHGPNVIKEMQDIISKVLYANTEASGAIIPKGDLDWL
ncbi:hypothetical protein Salat_2603400 [Sesamum alatum]|uniref:Uncharacterized protein n=1 Tax=Sesamum alatum TaxID=300844 RepID=A0AAE2CAE2_9LAMI|nr:hypothetical protein Salat_2603400 [Sesamum alatum]